MKKITIVAGILAASTLAFSQLSSRTNAENQYQIGTRPQAGDLGLMFGLPLNSDSKFVPINLLRSGDLLTGKYYKSDDIAFRGGLRLTKVDTTFKGTGDEDNDPSGGLEQTVDKSTNNTRDFDIRLGIEKHFSSSNIFDVYTGADLHLGFSKNLVKTSQEFDNGDFDNETTKSSTKNVGITPFVGVQVFVLDLPISIGLEYGIDALWSFGGNKEKVIVDSDMGGVKTNSEFFSYNGKQYTKLSDKAVNINTNQNVKLVLNLYFGGKKSAAVAQ